MVKFALGPKKKSSKLPKTVNVIIIGIVKINFVKSEIMNQLSYDVSSKKIEKIGFKKIGNIKKDILFYDFILYLIIIKKYLEIKLIV